MPERNTTSLRCPRVTCRSDDIYTVPTVRSRTAIVCYVCGRRWHSASPQAEQLPTMQERSARREREEALAARHGERALPGGHDG